MAKTSRERQAAYRKKMREDGYAQTTVFIPKKDKKKLSLFVNKLKADFIPSEDKAF